MSIFRLRWLSIFYRELATMINSGMDVIGAMDVLCNYSGDYKMRSVTRMIREYLLSGETLSSALSKLPQLFPEWQINIVRYSEISGRLGEGLERISHYLEKDYDIQKSLIVGLAYPFALLHMAVFLLPLSTLIAGKPINYIYQVLKVVIPLYLFFFAIYIFKKLLYLSWLKKVYDAFILNLPIFGGLLKRLALTRFIRALTCLYESGVNITQGWKIAARLCDNEIIKRTLLRGVPLIEQGRGISDAFAQTEVFSGKTVGMIAAGEKSGSIDKMLEKMATYCEKESDLVMGILVRTVPLVIYVIVAFYIAYRVITFYRGYISRVLSF